MIELGPDDARVIGLQRRFVEVVGGFRDVVKTASLKRNLEALGEAQELLKTLSNSVPSYVQVSVSEARPSTDAMAWARAAAMTSLRGHSELCAGKLDWSRFAGLDNTTRLAFSYLHAALDDVRSLEALCGRR